MSLEHSTVSLELQLSELRTRFKLPPGDQLSAVFTCILTGEQGDDDVPGRLFASQTRVCFAGDGRPPIVLPFNQVTDISRAPGGVLLTTSFTDGPERLLFRGFPAVDQTLVSLQRFWRIGVGRDATGGDVVGDAVAPPVVQHRVQTGAADAFVRGRGFEKGTAAGTSEGNQSSESTKSTQVNQDHPNSAGWGTTWLTQHSGTVRDIAVSPDMKFAVSASGDYCIHVCRLAPAGEGPKSQPATASSSFSSGSELSGASGGALAAVMKGHNHIVAGVSFSPDGCVLVSCSFDRTLRLWARPPKGVQSRHRGVNDEAAGRVSGTAPGQSEPWRLVAVMEGHTDSISCVGWCPKASSQGRGRLWDWNILSGSADHQVVLWHMSLEAQGVARASMDADTWWDWLPTLRLAAQCPRQGDHNGRYRAHDIASGVVAPEPGRDVRDSGVRWRAVCQTLWMKECHDSAVACCAWAPGGSAFVSGDVQGSVVLCWTEAHEGRGQKVGWRAKAHTRRVLSLLFNRLGTCVVSCSEDSLLAVYDAVSGIVLNSCDIGTSLALSLAWCPNEVNILVSTGGKRVKVLHLPSATLLGSLKLPLVVGGVPQRVALLAWDPQSKGLLVGLANFSVVYLQTAAVMVRHAIDGLLLRKGCTDAVVRDGKGRYSSLTCSSWDTSLANQSCDVLFSSIESAAAIERRSVEAAAAGTPADAPHAGKCGERLLPTQRRDGVSHGDADTEPATGQLGGRRAGAAGGRATETRTALPARSVDALSGSEGVEGGNGEKLSAPRVVPVRNSTRHETKTGVKGDDGASFGPTPLTFGSDGDESVDFMGLDDRESYVADSSLASSPEPEPLRAERLAAARYEVHGVQGKRWEQKTGGRGDAVRGRSVTGGGGKGSQMSVSSGGQRESDSRRANAPGIDGCEGPMPLDLREKGRERDVAGSRCAQPQHAASNGASRGARLARCPNDYANNGTSGRWSRSPGTGGGSPEAKARDICSGSDAPHAGDWQGGMQDPRVGHVAAVAAAASQDGGKEEYHSSGKEEYHSSGKEEYRSSGKEEYHSSGTRITADCSGIYRAGAVDVSLDMHSELAMLLVLAMAVSLLMVVAPLATAAFIQAPLQLCEMQFTALATALYNTIGCLQMPRAWIHGTPALLGRLRESAHGHRNLDDGTGAPIAAERWDWGQGWWSEWRGGALTIQACRERGARLQRLGGERDQHDNQSRSAREAAATLARTSEAMRSFAARFPTGASCSPGCACEGDGGGEQEHAHGTAASTSAAAAAASETADPRRAGGGSGAGGGSKQGLGLQKLGAVVTAKAAAEAAGSASGVSIISKSGTEAAGGSRAVSGLGVGAAADAERAGGAGGAGGMGQRLTVLVERGQQLGAWVDWGAGVLSSSLGAALWDASGDLSGADARGFPAPAEPRLVDSDSIAHASEQVVWDDAALRSLHSYRKARGHATAPPHARGTFLERSWDQLEWMAAIEHTSLLTEIKQLETLQEELQRQRGAQMRVVSSMRGCLRGSALSHDKTSLD